MISLTNASDLPLEIIYEIINQTDDRPTLRSCALTCKHLSVVAQKKLWSNLVIHMPYEYIHGFPTFQQLLNVNIPRERRKCLWVKRLELSHAKDVEQKKSSIRAKRRTVVIYKKGSMKRKYEAEKKRLEELEGTAHSESMEVDFLGGKPLNAQTIRQRGTSNRLEVIETLEEKSRLWNSRFEDAEEIKCTYYAPLKWLNCPIGHNVLSKLKKIIPRLQNLEEFVIAGDMSEVVWRQLMAIRSGKRAEGSKGVRSIVIENSGWPGAGRPDSWWHCRRLSLAFTYYPVNLEELEVLKLHRMEAEKLGEAISFGGSHNGQYPVKKKKNQTAWKQLKHLRIQETEGLFFFLGLVGQATEVGSATDRNLRKGLPAGLQTFAFSVLRDLNHCNDFPPDHLLLAFDQCANSLTSLTLGTPCFWADPSEAAIAFERFYKLVYFPNLIRFSSPATNGDNYWHDKNIAVDKLKPFLQKHGNTIKVLHIHRMTWSPISRRDHWFGGTNIYYDPQGSDPVLFEFYQFLAREMLVLEEFTYACVDGNVLGEFSPDISKRYFGNDGAFAAFLKERELKEVSDGKKYSMIERLRVGIPWWETNIPPHPWNEDEEDKRLSYGTMSDFLKMFAESEKRSVSGLKVLLLFPSYNQLSMQDYREQTQQCTRPGPYGRHICGYHLQTRDLLKYGSLDSRKTDYIHGVAEMISEFVDREIIGDLATEGSDIQENTGWYGIAWIVARMLHHLKILGIGEYRFWIQRERNPNPRTGIREVIKVWNFREVAHHPDLENIVKLDLSREEWKFLGRDKGLMEAEDEICCDRMAIMTYDAWIETYRMTRIY